MADHVRICDVAPRDGLQNEPSLVPTRDKARLVEALCRVGLDEIEVTSFVSPKWVPQLGDAAELLPMVAQAKSDATSAVLFSALVPNAKGMDRLLEVNQKTGTRLIDKASVFTAASETFSQRNTNATITQSLERFAPVIASAQSHSLLVRGYVSCAIACPFEGPIAPHAVAEVARRLLEMGAHEIDLGDTVGAATPSTTQALLEVVLSAGIAVERLVLHLHDTKGHAGECVRSALDMGVRSFDASAGGLGGCPYASTPDRRAPGNIATLTLLETITQAGYSTTIDRDRLIAASTIAREIVEHAHTIDPEPTP